MGTKLNALLMGFLTVLLFFSLSASRVEAGTPSPHRWSEYFGAQDVVMAWGKSVRGLGRGLTGVNLPDDFDAHSGKAQKWAALETALGSALQQHDVIVPIGGLESAGREGLVVDFMQMIEKDKGEQWKKIVRRQASRLMKLPNGERIYWQIGNELSSKLYSRAFHKWAGKEVGKGQNYDPFIIPYYVEYFLAPSVEALRTIASSPAKAPATLFTVAFSQGWVADKSEIDVGSARNFLASLLEYKVVGTFAPSLQGRSVSDLVDVVGVHYLATTAPAGWDRTLRGIHAQFIGKGRLRGLWATEELGKKNGDLGCGASVALKVAARYLRWWDEHDISPRQSRCIFWGWERGSQGTRAVDSMNQVYQFLGDVSLSEVPGGLSVPGSNKLDTYLFKAGENSSKSIAIVFHDDDEEIQMSHFLVKQGLSGVSTATLHLFSPHGHKTYPLDVRTNAGGFDLSLPNPVELEQSAAVLITIEKSVK